MTILTRKELDAQECADPDCDHAAHTGEPMWMHAVCHPKGDLGVCYIDGVLQLVCAECGKPAAEIEVAR
jgi:hypothetical protein